MKRSPLRKTSDRGRLRKEIGRLHLQVLLKQRGCRCEFTGKEGGPGDFARFHIIPVARRPRLEFADQNIIIYWRKDYYVWHDPYHHDQRSVLGQRIISKIIELRGPNYETDLYDIDRYTGKHDKLYLLALRQQFKDIAKELEG